MPMLAGRFRLVMPDWRGHGLSGPAPDGAYGPEAFIAEAIGLLDVLGIERAGVIGHDWGCFTSLVMSATVPERLTGVVAASTPHPWMPWSVRGFLDLWHGWYAALNALGLATGVTSRYVLGAVDQERYLRVPPRPAATKALYRWYWGSFRALMRRGPRPPLPQVPVRYLVGEHDPFAPPSWVGDGIPGIGVEWVPGARHSLPEERPELLAQRALEVFG